MTEQVIASRTFAKTVPGGEYLVATAKLTLLGGNARPYFSLTGELWQSEGWYRNGESGRLRACGQLHDEILAAFPALAPIAALQLADDTGAPMYAVENGWYWYSNYDGKGTRANDPTSAWGRMTSHERAAQYLRVTPSELPEGMSRDEFAEYVETLRPRWQREADEARAFLEA